MVKKVLSGVAHSGQFRLIGRLTFCFTLDILKRRTRRYNSAVGVSGRFEPAFALSLLSRASELDPPTVVACKRLADFQLGTHDLIAICDQDADNHGAFMCTAGAGAIAIACVEAAS